MRESLFVEGCCMQAESLVRQAIEIIAESVQAGPSSAVEKTVDRLMGIDPQERERRTRLEIAVRHLTFTLGSIADEGGLDPDLWVLLRDVGAHGGEPELPQDLRELFMRSRKLES